MKHWYRCNGVVVPLKVCIGPLPGSGAFVAQWSSAHGDAQPRDILPHPNFLRLSVMLEPLESRVWAGDRPVWGGIIGAHHFRICGPDEHGRWTQLSRCDIANIFLPLDTVRRFARLAGLDDAQWPMVAAFTQDRRVAELTRQMLEASADPHPLGLHYCDGLMTALIAYLLQRYAAPTPASTPMPTSTYVACGLQGGPLRRVLALIREQSGRDLYVNELAAQCGMSESHFSREFKRAVGMPPHQYLLQQRLTQAQEALSGTDERIGDIALNLGFTDTSHFSRLFAQRFGQTPTQFRRAQRTEVQR
ncbi:AraC family transcriptional regulator [Roseateles sp. SL47]|uniref:helix-turn-helix transcriptional regulator n=1 Tax=Roseateles sp. SL47 TaxID=2995138 RepID=UPI00226DE5C2|nr:AraC family transcriptional regulator [Roseateles sp. SL47]WAC72909.1 AraC family transcriptional regulator [Roseateles sp. SL47]